MKSTGLLTISVGEKIVSSAKKTVSANADDIVLLEIDVKDPVKRSPVSGSAIYGTSPSQFVIRHGDESQEVRNNCIHPLNFNTIINRIVEYLITNVPSNI